MPKFKLFKLFSALYRNISYTFGTLCYPFSIDKKSSVCYEPFIAEPRTVVSFTVVSEYEYPAEQCSYLLRYYASTIYASTNRVREYSALRRYVMQADRRSVFMSTLDICIIMNDITLYL